MLTPCTPWVPLIVAEPEPVPPAPCLPSLPPCPRLDRPRSVSTRAPPPCQSVAIPYCRPNRRRPCPVYPPCQPQCWPCPAGVYSGSPVSGPYGPCMPVW
ncbi:hypothetical protein EVAR_18681_1 [Eumeta japonica]|uniref:Uncharacterized protein n=1 Tax=Eumeta variegata TaxID=151549 RepID=A0A4C1U705_EUMVA|nr:hypothetical protein EVAR_18681_1 [Eumeta japonica]